ncbi:MAG: O-antigen ligase family protein, partial [Parcubacteria group bacterium]|nr:O-antigen ligase family protein [Parcubacteria group bacterium]
DTLQYRIWAWEIGMKGWFDRPIAGNGLGNYLISYNKYFNPAYQEKASSVVWYDKSHSYPVDLLNETGIVGFLAVILLLIAISRKIKRMPRVYRLILYPAILAYVIHVSFIFPSLCDLILLMVLLAFINNFKKQDYE